MVFSLKLIFTVASDMVGKELQLFLQIVGGILNAIKSRPHSVHFFENGSPGLSGIP